MLPNTGDETGSIQRLKNLAKVLGVAQPTALHMIANDAPRATAEVEAMPQVE